MTDPSIPSQPRLVGLKVAALVSVIVASLSVVGFVGYVAVFLGPSKDSHLANRVDFKFRRDPSIVSYASMKVYANGASSFSEMVVDSGDTVRARLWMTEGIRPQGPVGGKLFTVAKSAVELRLVFQEGSNKQREYRVSPVRIDCDREYPDYVAIRARLDSLREETARLSTVMGHLGPHLKADSEF